MSLEKCIVDPLATGNNTVHLYHPTYELDFEIKITAIGPNNYRNDVPLTDGCGYGIFVGHFDDKDVDFEIGFINHLHHRDIQIGLSYGLDEERVYYMPSKRKYGRLQALQTFGRQLRFLSPNSPAGQEMVRKTAEKHGTSLAEAAVLCSAVHFNVKVEYKVQVKPVLNNGYDDEMGALGCLPTDANSAFSDQELSNADGLNIGQRGVVGFGGLTNQVLPIYNKRFVEEHRIEIKPFCIEMRLNP
ncbi:uncharacterized protein LOC128953908 [Oppia nitens]|uniref:uncharacterized protein LOC128953908 n=1 Tax=Oppia nitens TaxID=1686743 RepID=UPI0023DB4EA3|nr:uncharacterized protein LOC128953908 [Oppia nitens]